MALRVAQTVFQARICAPNDVDVIDEDGDVTLAIGGGAYKGDNGPNCDGYHSNAAGADFPAYATRRRKRSRRIEENEADCRGACGFLRN